MSFTDDLLTRINQTAALDPAARTLLSAFLESNRTFLERLGPDISATLFRALFAGNPAPWDALVSQMDQSQLLALLGQTESALDTCIATRAAAMARLQSFTAAASDLALRLLANAFLSLL